MLTPPLVPDRRARVLTIVGTRPEGIKLAPVIRGLQRRDDALESRVAVTGQHTDMLDQVLSLFGIARDHDLGIMREGQDLHHVTVACLEGLRPVMEEYRPDVVLVQGDTASAFVGSLSAFYHRARVGHVEAGLRSGQKWAPFPEEMFRRLADVLTDFYFAPTARAAGFLRREGVSPSAIHLTGNTVIDALLTVARSDAPPTSEVVRLLRDGGRRLVLVTVHRRESFGDTMRGIFGALRSLADRHPDIELLFPVHPNPNVRAPASEILGGHERIHLVQPLDYLDLVRALERASLVLTDSGGIQEEAPAFGAPVLVLRDVTERPEGVEAGVVELVGTAPESILAAAERHLSGERRWLVAGPPPNPYGDGRAGERIADILAHALRGTPRRTSDWAGPGPGADAAAPLGALAPRGATR